MNISSTLRSFRRLAVAVFLSFAGLSGCVMDGPMTHPPDRLEVFIDGGLDVEHNVGEGILRLVNLEEVDSEYLEIEGELEPSLSTSIVDHRTGLDGIDGTSDDDPFDDLFELTELPEVETEVLLQLGALAWDLDLVPVVALEGVPFSDLELSETLLLVNFGSFDDLDRGASLDVRAAEALVLGRPYDSVPHIADRPFVGPTTLERLRDFAPLWLADGGPTAD